MITMATFRIEIRAWKRFIKKAKKYGGASSVLREFITVYNGDKK